MGFKQALLLLGPAQSKRKQHWPPPGQLPKAVPPWLPQVLAARQTPAVFVSHGKGSQEERENEPSTLAGRAGLPPMAMPVMAQSWPMTWVWAWASAAGAAKVVAASARMVARVNCIFGSEWCRWAWLGLKAVGSC